MRIFDFFAFQYYISTFKNGNLPILTFSLDYPNIRTFGRGFKCTLYPSPKNYNQFTAFKKKAKNRKLQISYYVGVKYSRYATIWSSFELIRGTFSFFSNRNLIDFGSREVRITLAHFFHFNLERKREVSIQYVKRGRIWLL